VKHLDLLDLPEEARDLVRECEAQGVRSVFERAGRPVAVLVSWDEYMALRETIEMANDSLFYARLEEADEDVRQERMSGVKSIAAKAFMTASRGPVWNDRVRISASALRDWPGLDDEQQGLAAAALRKIDDDPIAGAPLFEPFKGLWSYRTGDLRIVYRIVIEARLIAILAITRVT
jgi:mRNA-degrading endonuclease RelE of RelBE toxin-antitoxin system/PHD/YefM family antitoxin component YafN of YafNO toxin-antitoxin module